METIMNTKKERLKLTPEQLFNVYQECNAPGAPRREFTFVDDLADACLFVMQKYDGTEPINLGGGADPSIAELAELVKDVIGYEGKLQFDSSRPDGMPLKALDATRLLAMGWHPVTPFRDALLATLQAFCEVSAETIARGKL